LLPALWLSTLAVGDERGKATPIDAGDEPFSVHMGHGDNGSTERAAEVFLRSRLARLRNIA